MNDKRLKVCLRIAAIFLAVSIVFCIAVICGVNIQKSNMEKQRLDTETKLAEMQMPTFEPKSTEEVQSDEEQTDNAISENSAAKAAADALGIDDVTVGRSQSVAGKKVIVLDAGHGKSSSEMTADEKTAEGYEYNEARGNWGEWRHYKNGTFGENCHGSGCTGLSPENASCWYSMGNADRDTEPQINLNNALAAQKYLEQMGYEVRMTRTSNEQNPSMDKRVSYCFPNNDIASSPDAAAYICIHSNAGGGRGTSYIALGADYEQRFIGSDFIEKSNSMGNIINQKVASATGLSQNSPINTPYLILFNKCPVPIAYMEIGFYDSSDLSILQSSSDEIGKAIAEGVDEYLQNS